MRIANVVAALSLSGALVLGSQMPVQAAPVTALSAAAKPEAQAGQVVQVRFGGFRGGWGGGWHGGWRRGGGWGWGLGGLAAGALIGAAIASPPYWGDPYYAYDAYPVGPVGYAGPVCGPWGCGPGPYWRRPIGWRVGWGWGPGWW
jgi:hypothetical protein